MLARWRPKVGRSKSERIKVKMLLCSSAERWSTKRWAWGAREERGEGVYLCEAKVYSWFFAGARGPLSKISFFFILIGFKG
jgi:hypothetical protein